MDKTIVVEGEITVDGQLKVDLPPETQPGQVRVVIEPVKDTLDETSYEYDSELEELLTDESLTGFGLTAEEILQSPEIGIWKDREDMADSVEYVERMRHKRRMRRDE